MPEAAWLRRCGWMLVLAAAWLPMCVFACAHYAFDDHGLPFANSAVQGGDLVLAWTKGSRANVARSSDTLIAGVDL